MDKKQGKSEMNLKTCFHLGNRLTISCACLVALYVTTEDICKHPEPGLRNAVPVLLALDRLASTLHTIDMSDREKNDKNKLGPGLG